MPICPKTLIFTGQLPNDWSGSFFHDYSPNIYAGTGEWHQNPAVVLATFPKLIAALQKSNNARATALITGPRLSKTLCGI